MSRAAPTIPEDVWLGELASARPSVRFRVLASEIRHRAEGRIVKRCVGDAVEPVEPIDHS